MRSPPRDGSLESMEDTLSSKSKQLDASPLSPNSVAVSAVSRGHSEAVNPFFFDWFKQFAPKTPVKSESDSSVVSNDDSSAKTTPPRHPTTSTPTKPFLKQSEAVGAGWNAKGLQKARKQDWEGALVCWEKALDIRTQILPKNHKDVANTLNNMGIALGRLGREKEAMKHLHQALKIRTYNHGSHHEDVAATLYNAGNVLQQKGDYAGALESFLQAKRIQAHLLGDSNVQVARAWNAIGHVYFESGEYSKARAAYAEALETYVRAGRPEDDVEVGHTRQDLLEVEALLS